MSNVLQADIFFFVTTIAVVVVTIVVLVAGIFVIKTVRDIRKIVHTISEEATMIVQDVGEFREHIKGKAHAFSSFMSAATSVAFIQKVVKGYTKRKKSE
jgi:hypothetical protein